MSTIINKAETKFHKMIRDFGSDPYLLSTHVKEAEKWCNRILKKHPEANSEIVLIAVWLHDLGHYPIPTKIDHAIRGEERAKAFLKKLNYPNEKMKQVLHCIRAHRCNDIMPESIEAKIIACADSASHITDYLYFDIARNDKEDNRKFKVYAKMERDFRDLEAFPELQNQLKDLLDAWKHLIEIYEKTDLN